MNGKTLREQYDYMGQFELDEYEANMNLFRFFMFRYGGNTTFSGAITAIKKTALEKLLEGSFFHVFGKNFFDDPNQEKYTAQKTGRKKLTSNVLDEELKNISGCGFLIDIPSLTVKVEDEEGKVRLPTKSKRAIENNPSLLLNLLVEQKRENEIKQEGDNKRKRTDAEGNKKNKTAKTDDGIVAEKQMEPEVPKEKELQLDPSIFENMKYVNSGSGFDIFVPRQQIEKGCVMVLVNMTATMTQNNLLLQDALQTATTVIANDGSSGVANEEKSNENTTTSTEQNMATNAEGPVTTEVTNKETTEDQHSEDSQQKETTNTTENK